jgi:hypothetical protein
MQAVVAAPGGDVRVLVVDGESHPWHDRTPRLRAVAQICRDAERSGKPIDLIAGDFNAVGRSIGFETIADAGFTSAGASGDGWRATWPSMLPLYDIDHVWTGRTWSLLGVRRITNLVTDHRGSSPASRDARTTTDNLHERFPPVAPILRYRCRALSGNYDDNPAWLAVEAVRVTGNAGRRR